ncbi:MAG TPA: hypothetical protein DCR14_14645 [Acidimicrobiaceae bacterium]|nr:hypothetical protein [Acidimicrobiaceae bacterium]
MNWLPLTLPDRYEHDGIEFVPLTPALLHADYAAVMRDIPMLRAWSGQDWPTPEFTAAENLLDLERHDREQRDRVALTYSVLLGGAVQGCIYVHPFEQAWRTRDLDPPVLAVGDVAVRGWLHDRPAVDLVQATLNFLSAPRFAFPRLWWQTNDHCPAQIDACERLGLTDELSVDGTDRRWLTRAAPENGTQL